MVSAAPASSLGRTARQLAKGLYWAATPWKMAERLAFRRQRALSREEDAELDAALALEARRDEGHPDPYLDLDPPTGDPRDLLLDPGALALACGLPPDALQWDDPPASPAHAAARRLIDAWRADPALHTRFPRAWIDGADADFGRWIVDEGRARLSITEEEARATVALLDAGFARRARQAFLADPRAPRAWPYGLTPPGQPALLRWFLRHRRSGPQALPLEEILWLFLQAGQQPAEELRLAHAFTPDWQARFPDGLTPFGRTAFAAWFGARYGASGDWLDASRWPVDARAADVLRLAWLARTPWQQAHPDAFRRPDAARAFVAALRDGPLAEAAPPQARAWLAAQDAHALARDLPRPGLNLIGHFCYPSGLKVSIESIRQALAATGVPTSLRDVLTDVRDEPDHAAYRGAELHDCTLVHVQPDPFFDVAYARAQVAERVPRTYRIAYWYWEFDRMPDAWLEPAAQVDEVWTATEFIARGLRERLAIPVRVLFPGVQLAPFEPRGKAHFGLEEGVFTFLFTFHMVSVMERKNPLGLIRAFRRAFSPDEPVCLVLKTSFGDRHPQQLAELQQAAAGARIRVIDAVYPADDVLALMEACDAYVSLHRSEGLGLTMAEAMLMGKPVVSTGFSGNVDFMDEGNSLVVPHRLVKLDRAIPPYEADLEWAEPDEAEAARMMRRLVDDPAFAADLGRRAQASARERLSLEAAGRRIEARLAEIRASRD